MIITYFGSDLTDPAAIRRISVLKAAGVDVKILGFRRSSTPINEVEGIPAFDLGETFDGRLGHRCLRVLLRSLQRKMLREVVTGSDLLLGRNLEMATMAYVAKLWTGSSVPLAYECLDIHQAFVGPRITARLLRNWDKQILRRSATLILSSPGFVNHYFGRLGIELPKVVLAENKRVMAADQILRPRRGQSGRPPWRIGWFGKLRCTKSFQILLGLAQAHPDLVEVYLRGRPNDKLQSLIDQHLPTENVRFGGPYGDGDLAAIYGACDFTWGIDYAGSGSNSVWCLPNRLYEGGYHNKPVLAQAGTETAAWLRERGAGVVLNDPAADVASFFIGLIPTDYDRLYRASAAISTSDLVWTDEACREFAGKIGGGAST
jgi:succinoglycan biosynthesis protein ExoL